MLDIAPLREAFDELADAAELVANVETINAPPPGEWNADQILAHVAMVNAHTIAVAYTIAAGANATYDNRIASDTWSIENTLKVAGGNAGLRNRINAQAKVLGALDRVALSDSELDTPIPARLVSNGALVVDQVLTLRDLITGLADAEIPGHTQQLLALVPDRAKAELSASSHTGSGPHRRETSGSPPG